jgi:VanZ family protein
MPGSASTEESELVVTLVRRAILLARLDRYARVQMILASPDLMHYLVRKLAHFSEYLVLGILTFQALRLTFSHPVIFAGALGLLWAGVPSMDEMVIQRLVPQRSGELRDMLIDMAGFALGLAVALFFALLGMLFERDDEYD